MATSDRTRRLLAVGSLSTVVVAALVAIVIATSWRACRAPIMPITQRAQVRTMRALRDLSWRLETYKIEHGSLPGHEGSQVASYAGDLAMAGQPPPPLLDEWDRPIHLLVTPDRAHYMLLSAASDRRLEADIGGSSPRWEPWRDLALVDGSFFQAPEGVQCECTRADIVRIVAESREKAATEWQGPELEGLRLAHAKLLAVP